MAIEKNSPTWKAIEVWAKQEIKDGRDLLEDQNSKRTRGGIAKLRELLALGEIKLKEEIVAVDYTV